MKRPETGGLRAAAPAPPPGNQPRALTTCAGGSAQTGPELVRANFPLLSEIVANRAGVIDLGSVFPTDGQEGALGVTR